MKDGEEVRRRRRGRWSQQGQKAEERRRCRECRMKDDRRGGRGEAQVDKQGGGRQGRWEWRAECSSSVSLSFSSPPFQELMNSWWQWRRERWINPPSLSVFLYLSPSHPPSSHLSSPFALSPPGFLAGPQPRWLRLTSFIVCQQISGDRAGGLVRKWFGPKPLSSFFLFIHFFSLFLALFCFLLSHSCSHDAAAAAGAVAASINIVLMFWWLEPARW